MRHLPARTGPRTQALLLPHRVNPTGPPGPDAAPRNYVTLVLDSQTTDITNLKQVREGMIKYAREQITDSDVVALLSVTNGLQMLQPFTQDKAKLIAALENLGVNSTSKNFEQRDFAENIAALRGEINAANTTTNSITSTAAGSQAARVLIMRTMLAQFIMLRTALSLQQSRPILAALAAICEGLRPDPRQEDARPVFAGLRHACRARLASAKHDRHRESRERRDLHHRLRRPARECAEHHLVGRQHTARGNLCHDITGATHPRRRR